MKVGGHEENRSLELGFKVDITKLYGGLGPKEFLDWVTAMEEILEFKEIPARKRVPLITTRFYGWSVMW